MSLRKAKKKKLAKGPKSAGTAFDVKVFPDSKPGLGNPFTVPAAQPPAGDLAFPQWVDYYVAVVGSKLEQLNGLQFGLDDTPGNAAKMEKVLEDLGTALNIDGPNSVPDKLYWPLSGNYECELQGGDLTNTGANTFKFFLEFESDMLYRMVVNCKVQIEASYGGPNDLSSSSYLMTSSSSIP